MNEIRQQNLAKDAYKDPKNAEMLRKIESLEIKDGKIILKVRAKQRGLGRVGRSTTRPCPRSRHPEGRAGENRNTQGQGRTCSGRGAGSEVLNRVT